MTGVLATAPGASANGAALNPSVGYIECPASAPIAMTIGVWVCAQTSTGVGAVKPLAQWSVGLHDVGQPVTGDLPIEAINILPTLFGQPSIWLIEDDGPTWLGGPTVSLP